MAGEVKVDELVLRLYGEVSLGQSRTKKADRSDPVLTHHLERSKALSCVINPLNGAYQQKFKKYFVASKVALETENSISRDHR